MFLRVFPCQERLSLLEHEDAAAVVGRTYGEVEPVVVVLPLNDDLVERAARLVHLVHQDDGVAQGLLGAKAADVCSAALQVVRALHATDGAVELRTAVAAAHADGVALAAVVPVVLLAEHFQPLAYARQVLYLCRRRHVVNLRMTRRAGHFAQRKVGRQFCLGVGHCSVCFNLRYNP